MQFDINRDLLLKSLNYVQGVVEKKNTLPILSNVLLNIRNNKLEIVATDLDIVFYDEISELKVVEEGNTTTSANVLFDILRKIPPSTEINFTLKSENKLSLKTKNSDFNLLCLPSSNFPTFDDNFDSEKIELERKNFLSLLNKTKISISNDDTRHYLNGIFLHLTEAHGRNFLTGVATDSHRLSSSSLEVHEMNDFNPIILPRKTVYQLCSLLSENNEKLHMQISENKIKYLNFIVDDNYLKQNLYTPNYKVPIKHSNEIYKNKPDYIIILAWNYAEHILQKHKELKKKNVKFIIPFPEVKIVK